LGNFLTKTRQNLKLLGEFWAILWKKLRLNHLGNIYQKKMRPTPKNFAQMAKFRPIWSHCLKLKHQNELRAQTKPKSAEYLLSRSNDSGNYCALQTKPFHSDNKRRKKSPASRINQDLELGIRFWILEASH
jgi:hypothetical protein